MSDPSQSKSLFPTAGYEMFEKMWGMMANSPFSMFSGGMPQMLSPSLSRFTEAVAPLTNPEELDKRITDMRAIEQWLKLNLGMLQSATQALEVQRATLSTLRAFGSMAQSSMASAAQSLQDATSGGKSGGKGADKPAEQARGAGGQEGSSITSPFEALQRSWPMAFSWPGAGAAGNAGTPDSAAKSGSPASATPGGKALAESAQPEASASQAAAPTQAPAAPEQPATAVVDPSAWWNMLQSQFNQLASFAMPALTSTGDGETTAKSAPKASKPSAKSGAAAPSGSRSRTTQAAAPAAKKSAARGAGRKSAN